MYFLTGHLASCILGLVGVPGVGGDDVQGRHRTTLQKEDRREVREERRERCEGQAASQNKQRRLAPPLPASLSPSRAPR